MHRLRRRPSAGQSTAHQGIADLWRRVVELEERVNSVVAQATLLGRRLQPLRRVRDGHGEGSVAGKPGGRSNGPAAHKRTSMATCRNCHGTVTGLGSEMNSGGRRPGPARCRGASVCAVDQKTSRRGAHGNPWQRHTIEKRL